jgi:tetratricopeptide (TPR) repeat protein
MVSPRQIYRLTSICLTVILVACGNLCTKAQGAASQQAPAPDKRAAYLMSQGMNLAAQGQFAQAEVVLEQARTAAPGNVEVLTALAKVKDRAGELPAAIAIFKQVADADPNSTEAHLNLAMALADNADLNGALAEASKATDLSPKLAAAHLNRARILADLGRLEDARAEFVLASRLAPSNPDCFYYWALVEKENDNYAKESSLLQTVVRLQPGNEKALNLLGQSLFNESKEPEAIAAWRRALTINPNSSEATYSLSQALRSTDPQESKRLMERFHELQQHEKMLHEVNTLGNQAYEQINNHQWPEAIATLREGIGLCGDCEMQALLHKDLGLALCYSGKTHEGEKELQIAHHLNPADPDTLRALTAISHP